jgi:apolipoprotein N-acyltransferase
VHQGPNQPLAGVDRLSRSCGMALLGGLLVPLSFEPWGLASLLPISIWLLARSLEQRDWRTGLLIGWIFGLVVEGLSAPWIGSAVQKYLGIFVIGDPDSLLAMLAGVGAYLLWCPLAALGWGLVGATIAVGPDRGAGRWLLASLAIVVLESWWPRIFPWSLGSALATPDRTLGWWCLSTFGVEGLSLLLVLSGFIAASAGPSFPRHWRHSWRWLAALLWIAVPLLPGSTATEISPQGVPAEKSQVVSIVQPAISLETRHRGDEAAQAQQLATIRQWIERGSDGDGRTADLVILPEGILPGVWRESWLTAWLDPWLTSPLVVGFTRAHPQGYANSVAFYPADGKGESPPGEARTRGAGMAQLADKKVLVPFGERIPLGGLISALGIDLPLVDLIPASQQTVFRHAVLEAPLGVSICYEGILAEPIFEIIEGGARWHVNLTEDLWYGDWIEPAQHLQLQRSRAIESQLLWMRSANAGISAIIDPTPAGLHGVTAIRRWSDGRWSPWRPTDDGEPLELAMGQPSILQARIEHWPVPSNSRWRRALRWGSLPCSLLWLTLLWFRKKKG